MKTVCCVCRKGKGNGGWSTKAVTCSPGIVFGICPVCYRDAVEKIRLNYAAGIGDNNILPAIMRRARLGLVR